MANRSKHTVLYCTVSTLVKLSLDHYSDKKNINDGNWDFVFHKQNYSIQFSGLISQVYKYEISNNKKFLNIFLVPFGSNRKSQCYFILYDSVN
jgi:hypothetical protein